MPLVHLTLEDTFYYLPNPSGELDGRMFPTEARNVEGKLAP